MLTLADRCALAGYCQAYSRWAEAERKLQETPMLIKAPSGYIQQSPWLSIANKQLEWYDEMFPNSRGFRKLADKIEPHILASSDVSLP